MDNYESLRNKLISQLSCFLPPDLLSRSMDVIDRSATDYDITAKPVSIIPTGGIPEVVGLYLASKALENTSKATLALYRQAITNFFKTVRKPITDITPNDIRGYLYQYKHDRNICDHTLDTMRGIFSAFFGWLVNNDYLVRNPVAKVQKIKYQKVEKAPLAPNTLEAMRWACLNVREKALIDFLFSTGCRVSECIAVEISDINWAEKSVVIRHGKGDKRRTVFFNAESEVSLKKYLDGRKDNDPHLFVKTRAPYTAISKRNVERVVRNIRERMDTKVDCTPHTFRRTFATTSLRAGMPLERLQALMGHSKPETTMIYARLNTDDLKIAHRNVFI